MTARRLGRQAARDTRPAITLPSGYAEPILVVGHRSSMDTAQEQFLKDELASLTLMATVQRSRVYATNTAVSSRRRFQRDLRLKLEELATQYVRRIDEDTHIHNITALAEYLTERHAAILCDGRFRIGAAQKALNLHLKYLWCLGKINLPPHCPFDYEIIKRLSDYRG